MPELPEVQTTVNGVRSHLLNQRISKVVIHNDKCRFKPTSDLLSLTDCLIKDVKRIAKFIVLELDKGFVAIHLGMSGNLKALSPEHPLLKHDHVEIFVDSNKTVLRYNDARRFGGVVYFASYDDMWDKLFKHNGPDALSQDFSADYLRNTIINKNKPIKQLLMDGKIVVGIGNIYANESLYLSGINPFNVAQDISDEQYNLLVGNIKKILQKSIEVGGTTLKDFEQPDGKPGYFALELRCYGRTNLPCLDNEGVIESCMLGGRNTFFNRYQQPFSTKGLENYTKAVAKLN